MGLKAASTNTCSRRGKALTEHTVTSAAVVVATRRFPASVLWGLLVWVVTTDGTASGDDRISVRGIYYREASTRIVEPMVSVSKDLPEGIDVGAHYLLDAVTSASVAQGATQDEIFTERRHEAGLSGGYRLGATRVGAGFRYSREPDYDSRTLFLNLQHEVWGRTGVVSAVFAKNDDHIETRMIDHTLDVWFGGIGYTQALSPVALAQVLYETSWLDGYQANPYLDTPNRGRPMVPTKRWRHVLGARMAYYISDLNVGLQGFYRFYVDRGPLTDNYNPEPWGLQGHTTEARAYWMVHRNVELRFSYRLHVQSPADFWCNSSGLAGGSSECYGPISRFHSADVKYGDLTTQIPQLNVWWQLHVFRGIPFLGWFSEGAAELSYGRLFQSARYGDAHLLQAGYSLPF